MVTSIPAWMDSVTRQSSQYFLSLVHTTFLCINTKTPFVAQDAGVVLSHPHLGMALLLWSCKIKSLEFWNVFLLLAGCWIVGLFGRGGCLRWPMDVLHTSVPCARSSAQKEAQTASLSCMAQEMWTQSHEEWAGHWSDGEKRGLTHVACRGKRLWLLVSEMLSGLLTQNNPGEACLGEEARSLPVPWTQAMPLASSDLCLHPELPSMGTVVSRHTVCSPYLKTAAPF